MIIFTQAVRRKGVLAVAILPFVIPKVIGQAQPDTHAERFGLYRDHGLPEGLDKQEGWGEVNMDDGTTQVTEHSISYSPANGYIRVEEFCAEHLDSLREFLVSATRPNIKQVVYS
jgi:hypothetical protein